MIPFCGGLLIGVSLFGLLPELAGEIGWAYGLPMYAAGYLGLFVVDRYLHNLCPACAPTHHHEHCAEPLHGFAVPLACAAAAHAFLDGWGLVSVSAGGGAGVRFAFPLAVFLHKLPEGLALGAIFRASAKTRAGALGWCVAAEAMTVAGGLAGAALTARLGSEWTNYPLAIAGGCFLYLGYHAVHGEFKRSGAGAAFGPGVAGMAGAAVVQQSVQWFWR